LLLQQRKYPESSFSFMLRKASAVEEETKWAAWLNHRCNQAKNWTAGVTVMSLFASLLQKISMHMDLLCKIAFNWNILCQFEKCCKFSSLFKAKICNKSHLQLYLPVCKNMALPVSSAFAVSTSWEVRWAGRTLAIFSDVFWCDVVCTKHFSL
jgi:hypothetical protein